MEIEKKLASMIPEDAVELIGRLENRGFEAWVVGGCVRDAMFGKEPKDWDICTSAQPEEMQAVFEGEHVVETGLKHGTLTVVMHHTPYEITTYRVDGTYTDHRHPDEVRFVRDIQQDLSRRDLTINAMAWHPSRGLYDPFSGAKDLDERRIRCVGDPSARLNEDALRILRALRFASCYGFRLESETDAAVRDLAPTLTRVAGERVRVEIEKLLMGMDATKMLASYPEVITVVFPELAEEAARHESLAEAAMSVYACSCAMVEVAEKDFPLRLACLLHSCKEHAVEAIARIRPDRATERDVLELISLQEYPLHDDRVSLLHALHRMGPVQLKRLVSFRRAYAKVVHSVEEEAAQADAQAMLDHINALESEHACYTLKQLALRGDDLERLGIPAGPQIGQILNALLLEVMDGKVANDQEALLMRAEEMRQADG